MKRKVSIIISSLLLVISIVCLSAIMRNNQKTTNNNPASSMPTTADSVVSVPDSSFVQAYACHGIGEQEKFNQSADNKALLIDDAHLPIFKIDSMEALDFFKNDIIGNYDISANFNDLPSLESVIMGCDQEFFKTRTLFIVATRSGSGMIRYELDNLTVDGNTMTAKLNRISPNAITMDLVCFFGIISVDNDSIKDCTNFDAVI